MALTVYLTRHGVSRPPRPLPLTAQFRGPWSVDPSTGAYTAAIPSPSGIATDPPLAAHGVAQSLQLAAHVAALDPRPARLVSSPWLRCVQTVAPLAAALDTVIHGDAALGEWFGCAPFVHPAPAPSEVLRRLCPPYRAVEPSSSPPPHGESVEQVHARAAAAVERIVAACEADGVRAVLICTHAPLVVAVARALVGRPRDLAEPDFVAYTCGLMTFVRGDAPGDAPVDAAKVKARGDATVNARGDSTVNATADVDAANTARDSAWVCTVNADCSFLSGGPERGW
jgi:transcription factor C subunit 7